MARTTWMTWAWVARVRVEQRAKGPRCPTSVALCWGGVEEKVEGGGVEYV